MMRGPLTNPMRGRRVRRGGRARRRELHPAGVDALYISIIMISIIVVIISITIIIIYIYIYIVIHIISHYIKLIVVVCYIIALQRLFRGNRVSNTTCLTHVFFQSV